MYWKGHWTSVISSPTFSKESWNFYTIRSVGMGNDCMLNFTFQIGSLWRNMNISCIFYFSKLTSINTQYSSLWDTQEMMLFTKYLIKLKCIGRISWSFWYWFDLKSSIELDIKKMLYLSSAPLRGIAPWNEIEHILCSILKLSTLLLENDKIVLKQIVWENHKWY